MKLSPIVFGRTRRADNIFRSTGAHLQIQGTSGSGGAAQSEPVRTLVFPQRGLFSDTILIHREKTMKIHLVVALVGLAISFGLPTFAQQKDTADPELTEQLKALSKKTDDAYNNNDPAAVAALFTEDAVLVTPHGAFYGREAIEKYYADVFKQFHFSNHLQKADQYSPHIIGTTGDEAWSNGEWTLTHQGQNAGLVEVKGYWSAIQVREGGVWKKRLLTVNETSALATAQTK